MAYTLTEFLKFIKHVFGDYELSRKETDVNVKCPECKNSSKKKLVIQTVDNRVHCWVCGYKARSLIHLLKKYGSQDQLNTYLNKFYTGKRYIPDEQQEVITPVVALPEDFKLLLTLKKSDPLLLRSLNYLQTRDLTIDDIWQYRIGVSEEFRWKNRLIVPSFDSTGQLNDFVGRTTISGSFIKYDSPNPDKLSTIFNEINVDWTQRLVLCEGVFDAMKCGNNVVPLLGSELNEESRLFEQILIHNTPIALALDDDMWQYKTPKIAKRLQEFNIDTVVVKLTKPDPGSMTKDEFQEALNTAQTLTWDSTLKSKLLNMQFNLKI